jgi:SSS family solute:Na+ symporter
LNQFIVQRTLAAKTLEHGQLGIIFAAGMWLLVPFAIVFPGIMSFQLYGDTFTTADQAYPTLIRNLIPLGLRGFIFAALSGAVISSLASMLNSAATIFTIDLYKGFWKKDASEKQLITLGRVMTIVFVLAGCLIAPHLNDPRFGGVFKYIQEFQGYISPGILAAFVFGFVVKKAPPSAGVTALLLCVPVYGFLQWQFGEIAFLNRMAITFIIVIAAMAVLTKINPLHKPLGMPKKNDYSLKPSRRVIYLAVLIICGVLSLYAIYW